MVNFKDPKEYGRAAIGGTGTLVAGSYLLPVANQLLTFVPAKDLFLGVTPQAIVAYGIGFMAAMWINSMIIK